MTAETGAMVFIGFIFGPFFIVGIIAGIYEAIWFFKK